MSDARDPVDPLEETLGEATERAPLRPGALVGGYQLVRVLGEGGMGVVWLAKDPVLDRALAIKVLKRGDAEPALRLRLLREARAMARLKHANVLTVYKVGTEGERDFIAMELVEGGPLDEWLAHDPPRHDVVAAVLAAGRGLAAAHAAGLVHRDFKPNNVLRSRDGRVLVTDFGLARGVADEAPTIAPLLTEVAHDLTLESSGRADSVLHSPLTRTGALIGTPAYMAPEQYAGAPSDARTDQFAFCVTAWQALTRIRPFHGRTLEELRTAIEAGVAGIPTAELEKPVRAVLERGLARDPAQRWPDMDALLEALEGALRGRRRRGLAVVAGGVVAAGVLLVAGQGGDELAPPCRPALAEYAAADGPLRDQPAFASHRAAWLAEHEHACPDGRQLVERITCLRAIRDRTALAAELAAAEPAVDPSLLLVPPSTCARAAVPELPPEPARGRVRTLLGHAFALGAQVDLPVAAAAVEAEARAVAWPPAVPIALLVAGRAYLRRGDLARARDALARALPLAEEADPRLVAAARLALLEASLEELEHPDGGAEPRPGTLHEELARQLAYARAAVKLSGEDAALAGELALLEARAHAEHARQLGTSAAYDDALARIVAARRALEAAGDPRGLADAGLLEATLHLARGDLRALDDAEFAARTASELLVRARLTAPAELVRLRARVGFARGDVALAHSLFDTLAPPPIDRTAPLRTGIVRDAAGKPVAGALVVAWTGELHGDARRPCTDRGALRGEQAETARDGTFAIHAVDGAAILAQLGDQRSLPQPIAATNELRLAATTEVTGSIPAAAGRAPALTAFARLSAGAATWFVHAPVDRDLSFRLRGVPRGPTTLGLAAPLDDGARRLAGAPATLAWPAAPTIEVVARGALADGATAWLFAAPVHATTRAELEALAAKADDVASAPLVRVGARWTTAGRALYAAGDRHALLAGPAVVACVAPAAAPTAPVRCAPIPAGARAVLVR